MTRYAARTTLGFWTFSIAGLVQIINIAQRGRDWSGDVLWAADAQSIATFVIGPILCAVVAVDTARFSDPSLLHLVRFSGPLRHPYAFTTLAAWLPVAVIHLLIGGSVVATNTVGAPGRSVATAGLQLVVQACALLAFAAVGSLLGRFASRLAAGILGVVAALGLFYVQASLGEGFQLLHLGGATIPRLGLVYSVPYLIAQATGFLLVAGALLVVPTRAWRGRAFPSITAGCTALACGVLLVTPLPGLPSDRWLPDPRPPTDCSGSPDVCLFAEHAARRAAYGTAINRLITTAADAGYDAFVPARVDELSRTYVPRPAADERIFAVATSSEAPDDYNLVATMVTPVWCPQLSDDVGPGQAYWDAFEALTSTWLVLAGEPRSEVAAAYGREVPVVVDPAEAERLLAQIEACEIASAGPL